MPTYNNWGDLAEDLLKTFDGGKQDDVPRITFEASRSNGIKHMRPANRAPAPRGELPSIGMVAGWPSLCDVCLRVGIYIATWRGRDGAVVFIDVFNGNQKYRFEATTQCELAGAVSAARALIGGGEQYDNG